MKAGLRGVAADRRLLLKRPKQVTRRRARLEPSVLLVRRKLPKAASPPNLQQSFKRKAGFKPAFFFYQSRKGRVESRGFCGGCSCKSFSWSFWASSNCLAS